MKSRRQLQSYANGGGGGGSHTSSSGGGGGGGGGGSSSSSKMMNANNKMERKDVEKNRRLHMKGLCLKLSSLIPASSHHHHSSSSPSSSAISSPPSSAKETVTQLEHLDKAAAYIKQLKERIEELKQRKEAAAAAAAAVNGGGERSGGMPVVEVRCQEGTQTLDVVVVSESSKQWVRLHEVIGVLEEEGAEVVNASFSVAGGKVFYTLHSQALSSSRLALDASRVSLRLRRLLHLPPPHLPHLPHLPLPLPLATEHPAANAHALHYYSYY